MSDPNHPDDSGLPPIADAASLFDSKVVHTYNPSKETESSPPDEVESEIDEYGIDTSQIPTPPVPVKPVLRVNTPARPATPSNDFDLSDDQVIRSAPKSRSDSSIQTDRASHQDFEPESSDHAPLRSKKRSSDRATGFDDDGIEDVASALESPEEVDPIWTRGAEWGLDLVRVGAAALATLVIFWFALSWSGGLAFLILLLGGIACILLCYPMAVTIERPVRITPEQAVKDFFAAASHRFPHYRRMWLLLSPAARTAGRFEDFSSFRTSWSKRMATWKEGKGGSFTPLSFDVSDFRGDKSVGQSTSHVEYTVRVCVREQENEKPINTYRMAHGLVRGPDRMWYLNQGTLTSGR